MTKVFQIKVCAIRRIVRRASKHEKNARRERTIIVSIKKFGAKVKRASWKLIFLTKKTKLSYSNFLNQYTHFTIHNHSRRNCLRISIPARGFFAMDCHKPRHQKMRTPRNIGKCKKIRITESTFLQLQIYSTDIISTIFISTAVYKAP